MAEPRDKDARKFYRAARERWDDAEFLADSDRTTAAVYMAGYSVECTLKALVLIQAPKGKRADVLASFRGKVGHDFGWLRLQYAKFGGAPFPADIVQAMSVLDSWDTNLRYEPGTLAEDQAREFLDAVDVTRVWADGRLS